ncbi:MAG: hypothetical protein FWE70_04320, partial [Oscillospiraceae bacterium]|nr:hypothetical protein [Oscillospiraceae bacterium]
YLSFGYEAGMHGYDFEADERNRARTEREIGDIVGGAADVGGTLRRSNELAVDFISAMHTGRGGDMPAAIVYNGGAISNLPADLAVEIPIRIGGGGITKYHVGDLPMGPAAMLMHQVGPQQLSVEAAVRGDRGLALQALLSDPVVNSTVAAERILDELWEINKPYIRRCV